MIYQAIEALVAYGVRTALIETQDRVYVRNRLLDVLGETGFEQQPPLSEELPVLLKLLTDHAVEKGLCADTGESRDIFDTRLMDCLTPYPREVNARFWEHYAHAPEEATDWFYGFSGDVNYIRRDRIARDRHWTVESDYGRVDITINLSKPEKDPRDIAAALRSTATPYPLCQLCGENEGYGGRVGHPARANHRIIPLTLEGERWYFQYSPYVYYNEHCIVLNSTHVPMKISEKTFARLFDFVRQFPHYFVGSNADLPIVGGSILTHDHFQGGHYTFAMERAGTEYDFSVKGFEDISCGTVKWPLSVIRIRGRDAGRLTRLAALILKAWRGYSDEEAMILAFTDGIPHNTITPIARRRGEEYELDLCLRNNLTTPEHPLGLYHPHARWHHIKKENIGLIEVMGLAVLPSRLQGELSRLETALAQGLDPADDPMIAKHAPWASEFAGELKGQPEEVIRHRLEQEVGRVFLHVLEDAGVFKRTPSGQEAFRRFIRTLSSE